MSRKARQRSKGKGAMKLKVKFAVTAEIDEPTQAREWKNYLNHLQQLVADTIAQQLHDSPPPQSEQYVVRVTKTDYLV